MRPHDDRWLLLARVLACIAILWGCLWALSWLVT